MPTPSLDKEESIGNGRRSHPVELNFIKGLITAKFRVQFPHNSTYLCRDRQLMVFSCHFGFIGNRYDARRCYNFSQFNPESVQTDLMAAIADSSKNWPDFCCRQPESPVLCRGQLSRSSSIVWAKIDAKSNGNFALGGTVPTEDTMASMDRDGER